MGKNQAVEKAEYFAESIGRMAYQALLEEVYTVPKPGCRRILVVPTLIWMCRPLKEVQRRCIHGLLEWHTRDIS